MMRLLAIILFVVIPAFAQEPAPPLVDHAISGTVINAATETTLTITSIF